MFTISPFTLVHPGGFEPPYPVRRAVLQTAAFNQTRPQMLEAPVRFELTITVLQTVALVHLATGPGTPGRSRTHSHGFGGRSVTFTQALAVGLGVEPRVS